MTLWVLPILLTCICNSAGAEEPFWRAKEKIYQRITEQNEIIVSVTSQKLEKQPKKNRMNMAGGGQVAVPLYYAFQRAMDFNSLPKISEYVKAAHYDPQSKKLKMTVKAYGHEVVLDLSVSTRQSESEKFIDFLVVSGGLTGLKGTLNLRELSAKKTETGYAATFDYDVLPIPKLFIEFGLEVVIKRMAFRIRRTIENDFKKL